MAQNPEKWHLYMDESGAFEGTALSKNSVIAGLLIESSQIRELKNQYLDLCAKYKIDPKNHSKDLKSDSSFRKFQEELFEWTNHDFCGKLFVIEFAEDFREQQGATLHESAEANRYLFMAQEILEYIIFLNPDFYDKNIEWAITPNSRISVRQGKEIEMGYNVNTKAPSMVFSWTKEIVGTLIRRPGKKLANKINKIIAETRWGELFTEKVEI